MGNDTGEGNDMDYSNWISRSDGVGVFLVEQARAALDAAIGREKDDEDGAGCQIDTCLGRFHEIHRQCSRWKVLATMENLFRAYPEIAQSVGAWIEAPIDGGGGFFFRVNGKEYLPGESRGLSAQTLEVMEDIDGLEAINLAYDTLSSLCEREHPAEEIAHLEALAGEKTQEQLQGLMAMEAPELNSRVQKMWMDRGTDPSNLNGVARPRM